VEDAVIVGGAAMNSGLVKALEEMTGVSFQIPENPRTAIALGAAIQASLKKGDGRSRKTFNR
jgi:activator of 2-hydroxyglutaryl-CoA dehydratase